MVAIGPSAPRTGHRPSRPWEAAANRGRSASRQDGEPASESEWRHSAPACPNRARGWLAPTDIERDAQPRRSSSLCSVGATGGPTLRNDPMLHLGGPCQRALVVARVEWKGSILGIETLAAHIAGPTDRVWPGQRPPSVIEQMFGGAGGNRTPVQQSENEPDTTIPTSHLRRCTGGSAAHSVIRESGVGHESSFRIVSGLSRRQWSFPPSSLTSVAGL